VTTKLVAELLKKNEGKTDAQLAAELEVTAAHVSHIRAGRRGLSLDLVSRVLQMYPDLAPYHLLDMQGDSAKVGAAWAMRWRRRWCWRWPSLTASRGEAGYERALATAAHAPGQDCPRRRATTRGGACRQGGGAGERRSTEDKEPARSEGICEVKDLPVGPNLVAIVDDEDYDRVAALHWTRFGTKNGTVYAFNNLTKTLMHRLIMNAPRGVEVDHRDGLGLNNTRANLRLATHAQNMRNCRVYRNNTSGFKGVRWDTSRNKWRAEVQCDRKVHYVGLFASAEDAALAYDKRAIELFGEFARPNEMTRHGSKRDGSGGSGSWKPTVD
jgi:plasmid maintenance system antidote protein VapI